METKTQQKLQYGDRQTLHVFPIIFMLKLLNFVFVKFTETINGTDDLQDSSRNGLENLQKMRITQS